MRRGEAASGMGTAGVRRFAAMALGIALAAVGIALGAAPAAAVQEFPSNPTHRGVITVDVYQIFPENRPGNGVYFQNKLLLTLPNETVRHVLPLPKAGRFSYLAVDAQGKARIGVFLQPQDKQVRLTDVGNGFFHAIVTIDGVVYKKLFRVLEGRTVADLLPASKTAEGPAAGERGVVFYHVSAAVEPDPNAGNIEKQFGMQVHLALYDEEQVRHYEFQIFSTLPQLTLAWSDAEHLTYKLEDGRSEVLSLSQFQ
jgi:hypothetical protein